MTTQGDLEYVPGILQELSFDCHIYISSFRSPEVHRSAGLIGNSWSCHCCRLLMALELLHKSSHELNTEEIVIQLSNSA